MMSIINSTLCQKACFLSMLFLLVSFGLASSAYGVSDKVISQNTVSGGIVLALDMNSSIANPKLHRRGLQNILNKTPEFIGKMTGKDIVVALRDPDLERRDFPAIIWQYRGNTCVLDVYFYDEEASAKTTQPYDMSVAYYEFRKRGVDQTEAVSQTSCLNDINGPEFVNSRPNTHVDSLFAQAG